MIPELKALIVEYRMFYGLETSKEARKYIRKDLKYLEEQERGYIIIGKDKTKVTLPNRA
jgi:hypothetical protein